MYLTVHTPTSLIIGSQIHQPLLAFILAFLAHLILDIIPHDPEKIQEQSNKKTIKRLTYFAFIDLILIIILMAILWQNNKINLSTSVLAAVVGGIMPDILWGLDVLTQRKIKVLNIYHRFHSKFIHCLIISKISIPLKWVVLVQSTVFILTLWIYLRII